MLVIKICVDYTFITYFALKWWIQVAKQVAVLRKAKDINIILSRFSIFNVNCKD